MSDLAREIVVTVIESLDGDTLEMDYEVLTEVIDSLKEKQAALAIRILTKNR